MTLLSELASGACGVRLELPAQFKRHHDAADTGLVVDEERAVGWYFHRSDVRLDLQPQWFPLLERDVERHTRDLFEVFSRPLPRPAGQPLRTDDPTWSPVVSLAPVEVGGAAGLTVIHRMSYQPGHEMLMGHLLVPVATGLIEARLVASARETGFRESMLLLLEGKRFPEEDKVAQMRRLGQKYYDDPAHDEGFPDHPLSRVRAALERLIKNTGLTVAAPAPAVENGEIELPRVGVALTPPPRYLLTSRGEGGPFVQFTRASFAATDGIQLLSINRQPRALPRADADALQRFAEELTEGSAPKGARGVRAEVDVRGPAEARSHLSYDDETGRRQTVFRWLREASGDLLALVISAPRSAPREEVDADLDGLLGSLRRLEQPAKKWWKPWS